jgi:TonB-linked SusC/RagA family outer membrane protein
MQTKTGHMVCLTSAILLKLLLLTLQPVFAQSTAANGQKAPLEKVIKSICDKAGYDYLFDGKDFKQIRSVSTVNTNIPVEEAIKKALNGLPLSYTIRKKVVVIKSSVPATWIASNSAVVNITGMICDENKKALHGAVIKIKNTSRGTQTGESGFFVMNSIPVKTTLIITYVGYKPEEVVVTGKTIIKQMSVKVEQLQEVSILSNGYQFIPKERATGSFTLLDSALINRRVNSNILDRLDGVTSGVIFNKNTAGNTPVISIRDRSTIFADTNPLIVLDNFPYDGDMNNINPQDMESITILKDAAAASIWGSRAGNGVIVMTTKKGRFNQKPTYQFNSNISIGGKPDSYFKEQLTNRDYIATEQFLFDKGKYNSKINSGYASLSPAVEVMLLQRKNVVTEAEKIQMLDSIAAHDNRRDLNDYLYRNSFTQQYQLNVSGGGIHNKYYVSIGYDKNRANKVIHSADRYTMNVSNTTTFFKSKAQFITGLLFSSNNNSIKGSDYLPIYPYERIADVNGNALAVTDGTLSLNYADTAGNGKLLDWHYRPLDELQEKYHTFFSKMTNYKINLGLDYKIIQNFSFSFHYTYDKGINEYDENHKSDSYFTRNLINSFTEINQVSGAVITPVPAGDIFLTGLNSYSSHYGRGQLTYENEFSKKHAINGIAGYEIKDYNNSQSYNTLYGYDPATATNLNGSVNPAKYFPYYYNSSTSRIPLPIANSGTTDRYISYFINSSYTYDQKYIFSLSARRDQSNLFGVKSNQKGIPLWSAGFAWHISKEDYYQFGKLPYLKLRATFGYNGNVDKTTSAYLTTQSINGGNDWGMPVLQVNNPPNPSLRWEKVRNINLGLDFGTNDNKIAGSVDFWMKDGIDLIGQSPIAPQTGVSIFKGNSANTQSKGIDFIINSVNMESPDIKWQSTFLFNYNTDKVTRYNANKSSNSDIVSANYINPLEGYSYYSIFSYRWMGLDTNGDPQTLLNGYTSRDYAAVSNSTNVADLVYSGTTRPKYYGAFRNTFRYRSWELSVNILYRYDYYFRRPSLNNFALYQGNGYASSYQQADYNLRWQKPGDEKFTTVPALLYPAKSSRDDIYTYASILVEKADHIRLQDVRLDYIINKDKLRNSPFSALNLYFYATNLGTIWKATHKKTDPDYPAGTPLPAVTSLGLKANF